MIDKIALILAIIGGLNWGLVGIFQLDAVACSAVREAFSAALCIRLSRLARFGASRFCSVRNHGKRSDMGFAAREAFASRVSVF